MVTLAPRRVSELHIDYRHFVSASAQFLERGQTVP